MEEKANAGIPRNARVLSVNTMANAQERVAREKQIKLLDEVEAYIEIQRKWLSLGKAGYAEAINEDIDDALADLRVLVEK